jgi:hypothetical protein
LNVLGALRNGQHESIGDKGANVQRSLKSVVVNGVPWVFGNNLELDRAEAAEVLEYLFYGRGSDLIDARFVAHEILRGRLPFLINRLLGE